MYYDGFFDENFGETDRQVQFFYKGQVHQYIISDQLQRAVYQVVFDTDVTFTDQQSIGKGGYDYRSGRVFYKTDARKRLNGSSVEYGSYYSGQKLTSGLTVNYRAQPWGIFSIQYDRE